MPKVTFSMRGDGLVGSAYILLAYCINKHGTRDEWMKGEGKHEHIR
jgi:hypothetical protein